MGQKWSKGSPVERPIEAAVEEPEEIQEGPLDRALWDASGFRGDHEEVKRLLDEGANPNWPNPNDVSEFRLGRLVGVLSVVSHECSFGVAEFLDDAPQRSKQQAP